jgi:AcrR family transcriptional regulator
MEEVGARAGVTRMTVYRHFPSRTQLLLSAVRFVDEQEAATARFSGLEKVPSAVEALHEWAGTYADYVPRVHRLAQALLAARAADPAAAAAWADRMDFLRAGCRQMVCRLHHEGVLARGLDIERGVDLMQAIASIQLRDVLVDDLGWTGDEYRDHLTRLLSRALLGVADEP